VHTAVVVVKDIVPLVKYAMVRVSIMYNNLNPQNVLTAMVLDNGIARRVQFVVVLGRSRVA